MPPAIGIPPPHPAAPIFIQHRQGGPNTMKLVGSFSCATQNLLLQLNRRIHRHTGAAIIGNHRVGPIDGQRQALGHPSEVCSEYASCAAMGLSLSSRSPTARAATVCN